MTLRVAAGSNPCLYFEDPVCVWAPASLPDALDSLESAQDALRDGYWIAGALSYEFGALQHGIEAGRAPHPLLILGAFRAPGTAWRRRPGGFALSAPLPRHGFDEYARRLRRLLDRITDGEVYQVNYTIPFDAGFRGDAYGLYRALARRARAPYSAFLEYGDLSIASISPELFLLFDGERLRTKPMKGTAAPGRTAELHDEKNRAEHLMIVDLLRNDLHRICSNVSVEHLFAIERYPTFETMTSTIGGDLPAETPFGQVLRATFPCGSVTGAPKRAAMQHIASLEPEPRDFYTGSLGYLSPERRGRWNVAIRTLQIDSSGARFDAGGGIVHDSDAAGEWQEIGIKSAFLHSATRDFALLETLRGGPDPSDARAHVRRLAAGARAFGIAVDDDALAGSIARAIDEPEPVLVRVRLTRAGLRVAKEALEQPSVPVRLCFSALRLRSDDRLLQYKTTWRPVHDAALHDAGERGCFDAILCNERGEIAEGARTNIFVRIGNILYTPPLACGVLPGILRSMLVSEGKARERVLFPEDLERSQAVFAGNSARGLLPAEIRR